MYVARLLGVFNENSILGLILFFMPRFATDGLLCFLLLLVLVKQSEILL